MTVVTTTNLYTASISNLKNLIRDKVTNPRTGKTGVSANWIYEEEPDVKANDFKGYPIIIVRSPDISDEAITLNRTFKDNVFGFEVEVRSKFKETNASNVPLINVISDQIPPALRTSTNTTTLDTAKMWNLKIESSAFNGIDEAQQRLSVRVFSIEINTQLNM